jgi:hypothetical protein
MISQYLILNDRDYFALAEEHIRLDRIFNKQGLGKLLLWIDMLVYPFVMLFSTFWYGQNINIFTIMTIHKMVTMWVDWFQYYTITQETLEWKKFVQSAGGPFISTNDPTYHLYVYADGMQRLKNSFFKREGPARREVLTKLSPL